MSLESLRTVPRVLLDRVTETPDKTAYLVPGSSGMERLSWGQVGERVQAMTLGLRELGISPGERCAILSGTRIEWVLADFAILIAGAATTTIYPSSTAEETAHILSDSEARLLFVEDRDQLAKLADIDTSRLVRMVLIEGEASGDPGILKLGELEARGRELAREGGASLAQLAEAVALDDLATLIYTSGTSGKPKGVQLAHASCVYAAEALVETGILDPGDRQFLWLPLAHVFGRGLLLAQLCVGFETLIDGRIPEIRNNLEAARPSFMAGVPRIFEKIRNEIISRSMQAGKLKSSLFRWAMETGREVAAARREGARPSTWLGLKHRLADRLVLSKLRNVFGGRIRYFICGSAPLSDEVAAFFHAAGLPILEGYGLTETSAAVSLNRPDDIRIGTVGRPFAGTEIKIAESDGEILVRGPGVMRGYYNLDEATRNTFTADGWFLTGDIGRIDEEGRLTVTDRKKDLIKTSGGKYVAPQVLEGRLKALTPYVSQVLVHGERRQFVSALVTLDLPALGSWLREEGLSTESPEALAGNEKVRALVSEAIDRLNAGVARHESIRKFSLLPHDLSIEAGELTPSLKMRRKIVEERYRKVLDAMYA